MILFPNHMELYKNRQAPPGLFEQVVSRIDSFRRRQARVRLAGTATLLFALFPSAAWLARAFWLQAVQTGFGQYLSLAFSDFSQVLINWQDYALSLIESFPLLPAIEVLSVAFVALLLAQAAAKYRSVLTT